MSELKLVGIGPGSPDYVTDIAKRAVQSAEIVIGAQRALDLFKDYINGEMLCLTAKNVKEGLVYGAKSAQKGKNVVILSTGDPGFSGLLGSLLNFAGKQIDVEVIPGVSSLQLCAARLRMRWDTALLLSFHADVTDEKKSMLVEFLKYGKTVMLLPDPNSFGPCEVAKYLIDQGLNPETSISVCENLSLENERVATSTLGEVLEQEFEKLCVIVVRAKQQTEE
ncbi:MAG: precorrin-6y C5,15-methyltransferase (decarboxylating) subunit CbiE [Candidatus Bathyarchaeota archaeon]|nr:precorrin-6y C5,15-methyltransferase (decarboxylating) subunit CbiE [Candidatus Bathyarchaeota archaeon]